MLLDSDNKIERFKYTERLKISEGERRQYFDPLA